MSPHGECTTDVSPGRDRSRQPLCKRCTSFRRFVEVRRRRLYGWVGSEPVAQARGGLGGLCAQQLVEGGDDAPDRSPIAAGVPARGEEYEAVVGLAALVVGVGDGAEVGDVLCNYGALLLLGEGEEVGICERAQLSALGHRACVVTASA